MKRPSPKNPVARGRDIITCIKMWSWRLHTKDFCSKSHKSICFYYIFLPGFWPNKSCSAHVFLHSQTEARTSLEVHHSRGGAKDQPEPIDRRNRSTKRLTGRKWDDMLWPKTLEKYLQVVIFFNLLRIVRYHLQTLDTNLGRFLLWVNDNL